MKHEISEDFTWEWCCDKLAERDAVLNVLPTERRVFCSGCGARWLPLADSNTEEATDAPR